MGSTTREYHTGIVTDNADPEKRGRLKIQCGTLLQQGVELPDWVDPVFPYLASGNGNTTVAGWMFVPDIGVVVEVELSSTSTLDEVPGMISFDAGNIRWRACIFAQGKDVVHPDFLENYPNRRGIITGAGHQLLFDDTDGSLLVQLLQKNATNDNLYLMDKSGILVESSIGVLVHTTTMVVKDTSPVTYYVLMEGTLGFSVKLAASLTEIAAGLAVFGIPTTQTAVLIAALSAGAFTSGVLKVE